MVWLVTESLRLRVYLQIEQGNTDVFEVDMSNSMCLFISHLPYASRACNQLLLLCQERSFLWTVWQHEECDNPSHDAG